MMFGIADLQREGCLDPRPMQHGLAMAADGAHGGGRHRRLLQQLQGRECEFKSHGGIELAVFGQADMLGVLSGATQATLQSRRPVTRQRCPHTQPRGRTSSNAASMPSMLVPDISPR